MKRWKESEDGKNLAWILGESLEGQEIIDYWPVPNSTFCNDLSVDGIQKVESLGGQEIIDYWPFPGIKTQLTNNIK